MAAIVLTTINARYIHASLGLRRVYANLGELRAQARIEEFCLTDRVADMAEQILALQPAIVGIGVYIWNAAEVRSLVGLLKRVAPGVTIVLGGPEVSHLPLRVDFGEADYLVRGEGEIVFGELCRGLLAGRPPAERVLAAEPPAVDALAQPYPFYTDQDLAHRLVYVEAARGCPFQCEFCLSALDHRVRPFALEPLLAELETLWQRGARTFKFVDRTFNSSLAAATRILDFFLARAAPDMRLHFEINADFLHLRLASRLAAFPKGALHLETGIQTLNPRVAAIIGRRGDTAAALDNLRFLTQETGAAVHADLIFGLPGEDEASFAQGFNALLAACSPAEVQVNQLKVLPGTRLAREAERLGLAFNPEPPYEVLRTDAMTFDTLVGLHGFARCWELVYNRSRFPNAVRLLHAACRGDYYRTYQSLATRIRREEGRFFAIALPRLAALLRDHLVAELGVPEADADRAISRDLNGGAP